MYRPAPRAMASVDTHLETGERVVFRTRLHPVVFAGTVGFSAFVIGAVTLIVARNELASRTVALLWLGALAVIAFAWVSPLIRFRRAEFAATSEGLLVQTGLLRVHAVTVRHPRAGAVDVEQTLCGRWLGYGTLRIVAEDDAVHVFPRVARADALRAAVRPSGRPRTR